MFGLGSQKNNKFTTYPCAFARFISLHKCEWQALFQWKSNLLFELILYTFEHDSSGLYSNSFRVEWRKTSCYFICVYELFALPYLRQHCQRSRCFPGSITARNYIQCLLHDFAKVHRFMLQNYDIFSIPPNFWLKNLRIWWNCRIFARLSSQEESTFLVQKASVYACFLQLKPEKFQRLEASRTLDARGVYCSLPGMLRAYCALSMLWWVPIHGAGSCSCLLKSRVFSGPQLYNKHIQSLALFVFDANQHKIKCICTTISYRASAHGLR